ncbi:MAG TPA: hypothetical protein VMU46_13935 [Burkholderiales bacterium]|nr:hypothetical protein [Burkholderiales bacterium]
MTPDSSLAEFEFHSGPQRGSHLALYANRLVHQGGDSAETVPLAQLAAVRVAFERDPRNLNWAIALLVFALILAAVSGPLQNGIASLAAGIKEHAGRESLDAVLLASFSALGGLARLLAPLAAVLAAIAVALLVFFMLGQTILTLSFAAVERAYAVRGRNRLLFEFAETLAGQLAARKG